MRRGGICKITDKVTIGRESVNTFQIFDNKASRVHVHISIQEDGSLLLEDFNSVNGTFVNGLKVRKLNKKEEEELESELLIFSSGYTHAVTQIQVFRCPDCSSKVEANWKFCPNCGKNSKDSK